MVYPSVEHLLGTVGSWMSEPPGTSMTKKFLMGWSSGLSTCSTALGGSATVIWPVRRACAWVGATSEGH